MQAWLAVAPAREHSVRRGSRVARNSVAEAVATKSSFDLMDYMTSQKDLVDAALEKSLKPTSYTEKIIESMRYSLLAGGKRVRPIMCLAAYDMIASGGSSSVPAAEAAMPTAVALEMVHTMSLIHDDLPSMDNDDLRRGMPTNHVKYGEDIAILAGDAMLSESFGHIARETPKSVPAERVVDVIGRLSEAVGADGLVGGQVMDLECEQKNEATLEELQWIHEHKTAVLLEVAVVSGAILAGATDAEVQACKKYAQSIGLAFQVADDILDVTQSSEQLGKTAGKDLAQDKTTYVKLLGLEGAREEAARLKAEALDALEPFGDRAAALRAIGEFIVSRTN